jgi:hypothetical protein
MLRVLASLFLLGAPVTASANEYQPVRDRQAFLSLVEDRALRFALLDVTLTVLPDGQIVGSGRGREIVGSWSWQDGYFCRELDWSGKEIGFNCQLVEAQGDDRLRFTSDRGEGQAAVFRLR